MTGKSVRKLGSWVDKCDNFLLRFFFPLCLSADPLGFDPMSNLIQLQPNVVLC